MNLELFQIHVHMFILSMTVSITFIIYSQEQIPHKKKRVNAFKFNHIATSRDSRERGSEGQRETERMCVFLV